MVIAASPTGPAAAATLRGEAIACPRCGLLLAMRTPLAVVAIAGGVLALNPEALACECGYCWTNPDAAARRACRR